MWNYCFLAGMCCASSELCSKTQRATCPAGVKLESKLVRDSFTPHADGWQLQETETQYVVKCNQELKDERDQEPQIDFGIALSE